MAEGPKSFGDLQWAKGSNHPILEGSNGCANINVKSLHVSCRSDKFDPNNDYIGFVLYQHNHQNEWSCGGVRCRSGYIYLVDSSKLQPGRGETYHECAYYTLFSEKTPKEGKLVASGFAYQNKEWKEKSSTFNAKQTAFTREKRRDGVPELDVVRAAIMSWMNGNGQNYSLSGWNPSAGNNRLADFGSEAPPKL